LASDSSDWAGWRTPGVLALVYACVVAHEVLHDERLRPAGGSSTCLALAMLLMTAAATLLLQPHERGRWWSFGALVPGCLVLAWLFLRHCRRRQPGLWPYAVFVVSFTWIACRHWA